MATDAVHIGFEEKPAVQDDAERFNWAQKLERKPEMVHKNPDAPITAEQSEMMDPFYKMWVEGVK